MEADIADQCQLATETNRTIAESGFLVEGAGRREKICGRIIPSLKTKG
jgi:hypothetical protein